jgi:hypothetical protein
VRRVLTAYLAFLMAAAPCLCCCMDSRVVAAASDRPAEPPRCCCAEDSAPVPVSHPPSPNPPEPCPCRDHADKQALADPVAARSFVSPTSFPLPAITSPVGEPSLTGVIGPADCGWPYPIPLDLLHLHHRLRC